MFQQSSSKSLERRPSVYYLKCTTLRTTNKRWSIDVINRLTQEAGYKQEQAGKCPQERQSLICHALLVRFPGPHGRQTAGQKKRPLVGFNRVILLLFNISWSNKSGRLATLSCERSVRCLHFGTKATVPGLIFLTGKSRTQSSDSFRDATGSSPIDMVRFYPRFLCRSSKQHTCFSFLYFILSYPFS